MSVSQISLYIYKSLSCFFTENLSDLNLKYLEKYPVLVSENVLIYMYPHFMLYKAHKSYFFPDHYACDT